MQALVNALACTSRQLRKEEAIRLDNTNKDRTITSTLARGRKKKTKIKKPKCGFVFVSKEEKKKSRDEERRAKARNKQDEKVGAEKQRAMNKEEKTRGPRALCLAASSDGNAPFLFFFSLLFFFFFFLAQEESTKAITNLQVHVIEVRKKQI